MLIINDKQQIGKIMNTKKYLSGEKYSAEKTITNYYRRLRTFVGLPFILSFLYFYKG